MFPSVSDFDPALSPARLRSAARNLSLAALVGALAGTASAGFLLTLDHVTAVRFSNGWLLAFLPLAGVLAAFVYRRVGDRAEGGANLILDEIHTPGGGVPLRMAPLVLGATLLTHLCGGSAGREGTAVQMGGALAGGVRKLLRIDLAQQGMLLSAGVAGGFGAVFGTPLAGAVFAVEVLTRGRLSHAWLGTCLLAALVGDQVCHAWGVRHDDYGALANLDALPSTLAVMPLLQATALGLCCGYVARGFIALAHGAGRLPLPPAKAWWMRPALGGITILLLALALRTDAYLGLGASNPDPGVPTLLSVWIEGGATPWSWFWKLVFTALTVGAGFKGGEVTPLFFIGAAFGHVAGPLLGLPLPLGVALGFVAVFAGASKTPLACTLLAVEIFGGDHSELFAVACLASYLASGAGGIYSAQRQAAP
jgi:Chloride channel protein EriC